MVSFGNGITTIGEYAFNFCTNLTKVQFASIESLCNIDFKYGSNPLSVSSKPSYLFINEEEIKELKIPNGITSIRDYTFCGCSSLTSVDIPNTVTSIGNYAFSGCSNLTTVIMPNSVNYIGGLAFADCRYLTDVYCYFEKMPETNYGIFENSDIEYSSLYVPETSIDAYTSTAPWSSFGTIKAIKEENDITKIETSCVKISSIGNSLCITGAENISLIEFYNLAGSYLGAEQVINGEASFDTDENLVIVKIGEKSIKVKK